MSFTSYEFIAFLIAIFLLYYLIPKKFQWILLLLGSCLFYAYAGISFLAYILITAISTWGAGVLIGRIKDKRAAEYQVKKDSLDREAKKAFKEQTKKKTRWIFLACLLLNLGILAVIKYTDFVIENINSIFGSSNAFMHFAVPLGISYYTFKSMGYLIDVNRGKYEPQKDPAKFLLFVSFFPQVIQGPISRYDYLSKSLFSEHAFDAVEVKKGFVRVLWGFAKKLIIADRLVPIVKTLSSGYADYRGAFVLLLILLYAIQLYADFTGGIDIAIGIGEMLGIKSEENFITPYFSKNINEYWTRWHITMGSWFKDYIFYPLSLNKGIIKLGKKCREVGSSLAGKKNPLAGPMTGLGKRIPIYIPMFMVWFTTGMWHGSQNRYVVWGLFNCFFIILGTELEPVSLRIIEKLKLNEAGFMMRAYRVIKTFWLMSFLRIFDISKDVPSAFNAFKLIFSDWSTFRLAVVYENLSLEKEDFIVAVIAILVMFIFDLIQRKGSVRERIFKLPVPVQWVILSLLIVTVSVFGYYGPGYDAGSFIYGAF